MLSNWLWDGLIENMTHIITSKAERGTKPTTLSPLECNYWCDLCITVLLYQNNVHETDAVQKFVTHFGHFSKLIKQFELSY